MKPILSPDESAELDRLSRERGVTVETLMENAGRSVARAAAAVAGGCYGRRVVAVCGKGNNGGDGLVAVRHLTRWGMGATAVLMEDPSSLREPAATMLRRLEETGARVRPVSALARELARADVAVDAIFGTGFRGMPEDASADAIVALNGSGAAIVSVDIPSGVNGANGAVEGDAVRADVTVTFGAAKPGLLLHPGAAHAGVIQVVDIGFPPDLVRSDLSLMEASDVASWWPHREPEGHKRSSGVVLVIAGSRGMTGAVRLVAGAAYRAGAGLVTVAVPEGILPVVQEGITEGTFVPLAETGEGTIAAKALEALEDRLDSFDAIAIGPGLTTNDETVSFVHEVVGSSPLPIVVDADALNAFAGRAVQLRERKADLLLTPHTGEFTRLSGGSIEELARDRVGGVRGLAAHTDATVLLKGRPTLVASPGGEVRLNPTGGPALSTGGTGDVLTGVIAALLARGVSPLDAGSAGAYVHGRAGDLAGLDLGEGATAVDVMDRVPEAVRRALGSL